MKKLSLYYLFIFLFFCQATHAQKAKLGPVSESAAGELQATDPVAKKHFYKSMSYTLKAGQGIVFYMQSSAFTPSILLTGKDGSQIGAYNQPEKENNQEVTVAANAFRNVFPDYFPTDTTVNIFFSSVEENATGKFNYGFIMLDSSQMLYDEKGPLCNRLIYLINQWQAGWCVIPVVRNSINSRGGGKHGSTVYSLMPDKNGRAIGTGWGNFTGHRLDGASSYNETLFSSTTDNGIEFYQTLIHEVHQCLGDKDWIFRTEIKEDKNLKEKYTIYSVQIKGTSTEQPRTQFIIVKVVPENVGEYNPYEVILLFN